MTRHATGWLGALLLLGALGACGGEEEEEPKNSLTFGTGITGNGFTLTGEASSFSLAALGGSPLWFRLESAEDINKRFVRLYFDDLTNKDFTAVQDYGHLVLATFTVQNPGTYQVKAYYVETIIDIGQETLIAQSTLTITP